jgi:hypothetical protein
MEAQKSCRFGSKTSYPYENGPFNCSFSIFLSKLKSGLDLRDIEELEESLQTLLVLVAGRQV